MSDIEVPGPEPVDPEAVAQADTGPESAGGSAWTPELALAEWNRIAGELDQAKATYEAAIAPAAEAYEQQRAPLEEKLGDLEAWFVAHAQTVGANEFASDSGKVTISTRESPKIDNADSFFAWVAETNNAALLQKRISVTQFRQFQKANSDAVPPGVVVEVDHSAKFKAG